MNPNESIFGFADPNDNFYVNIVKITYSTRSNLNKHLRKCKEKKLMRQMKI